MKVLVTGANGLLGKRLIDVLVHRGNQVTGTGKGADRVRIGSSFAFQYRSLDLADHSATRQLIDAEIPDIIIHAGAMTQVDECELHQEQCWKVNVDSTGILLEEAAKRQIRFIFLSTDFVFDGEKGNYRETDLANPVNWYGQSKLRAESLVQQAEVSTAILRTCLVYGNKAPGARNNLVTWVQEQLDKKIPIKVVDDQLRTPTYLDDLVAGILLVMDQEARGIFHISGEEWLTPYQMAKKTAAFLQLDHNLIERVDGTSFTQPGKRPPKTGFDISRAKEILGYQPRNFEAGLRAMFTDLVTGK